MEIRPPINRAEHRAALARLIDRAGWADPLSAERVATLEAYVAKRGLSLDHCLLACHAGRIEAVCVCLDAPGRTATLLLSPGIALPRWRSLAVDMVSRAQTEAGARDVQLLQGMVAEEAADEALVYAAAGFRHLARLIYLQADELSPPDRPPRDLNWLEYGPNTHERFTRVIEGTYEGSLDCGSLNGVRHIEDIVASHKATGQFDPRCWRMGCLGDEPVGVILLAFMDEQRAHEVVYLGCLPSWRGQGYGASLLAHGFELTRARGLSCMTVCVDEKNQPARELYQSFGFGEVMRREVWIDVLPPRGGIRR